MKYSMFTFAITTLLLFTSNTKLVYCLNDTSSEKAATSPTTFDIMILVNHPIEKLHLAAMQDLNITGGVAPRDRHWELKQRLEHHSYVSQAAIHRCLSENPTEYESKTHHWLANSIEVKNVSRRLLRSLEEIPSVRLIQRYAHTPVEPAVSKNFKRLAPYGFYSPLKSVNDPAYVTKVDRAKKELGVTAEDVIIGVVDNYFDFTHVQFSNMKLLHKFIDKDMLSKRPTKKREALHGNAVLSAIAGKDIGVAPEASFVTCYPISIKCLANMICPNNKCEDTPNVLNVSFQFFNWHLNQEAILRTFSLLGITIVAAIGNKGGKRNPTMKTSVFAKLPNVVLVGAASQSWHEGKLFIESAGSSTRLTPTVLAPGRMWVADTSSTKNLVQEQGTSFSTPQITGIVALMIGSAKGKLSPELISRILCQTADLDIISFKHSHKESDIRMRAGCGLVDAYAAIKKVLESPGALSNHEIDARNLYLNKAAKEKLAEIENASF